MIDYTQFGAQTMGPLGTDEEQRRVQQQGPSPVQQPAPVQQPTQQPTQPRPATQSGSIQRALGGMFGGQATGSGVSQTFAQLQAAGMPRPAPPPIPAAQPAAQPMPGQQATVDNKGTTTLSGPGVTTTIPASQAGGFGGYDPNKPPPGYQPEAWRTSQDDLNRGALIIARQDGTTTMQSSERYGNGPSSLQSFVSELQTLENDGQRQMALFNNPTAYRALQERGLVPAAQRGDWAAIAQALRGQDVPFAVNGQQAPPAAPAQTGGPNLQSALGGALSGGGIVDPRTPQTLPSPVAGTPATPTATGGAPASPVPNAGGSGLQGSIQQILQQLLTNPTAYGTDAMRHEFESGARGIDDEYSQRQTLLKEEMARRGLSDSSIYGGRMADLNVGQRSAETELLDRLLTKRADAQDSGIRSALAAAMGFDSDLSDRSFRDRSFGESQRQFDAGLGLDRDRLSEQQRQYDQNLGFDRERYQGDSQFRDKQFDADEKARQDAFLRAWFELFGGAGL